MRKLFIKRRKKITFPTYISEGEKSIIRYNLKSVPDKGESYIKLMKTLNKAEAEIINNLPKLNPEKLFDKIKANKLLQKSLRRQMQKDYLQWIKYLKAQVKDDIKKIGEEKISYDKAYADTYNRLRIIESQTKPYTKIDDTLSFNRMCINARFEIGQTWINEATISKSFDDLINKEFKYGAGLSEVQKLMNSNDKDMQQFIEKKMHFRALRVKNDKYGSFANKYLNTLKKFKGTKIHLTKTAIKSNNYKNNKKYFVARLQQNFDSAIGFLINMLTKDLEKILKPEYELNNKDVQAKLFEDMFLRLQILKAYTKNFSRYNKNNTVYKICNNMQNDLVKYAKKAKVKIKVKFLNKKTIISRKKAEKLIKEFLIRRSLTKTNIDLQKVKYTKSFKFIKNLNVLTDNFIKQVKPKGVKGMLKRQRSLDKGKTIDAFKNLLIKNYMQNKGKSDIKFIEETEKIINKRFSHIQNFVGGVENAKKTNLGKYCHFLLANLNELRKEINIAKPKEEIIQKARELKQSLRERAKGIQSKDNLYDAEFLKHLKKGEHKELLTQAKKSIYKKPIIKQKNKAIEKKIPDRKLPKPKS